MQNLFTFVREEVDLLTVFEIGLVICRRIADQAPRLKMD